ncbi:hypothetical protein H2200_007185 [Cladophialophora chaetospira]|uniref:SET domain-containing protein n=1 Tax=Cladophialophora chaetospira TaxID=386627 RepID=A0AA38X7C5_9EURO|nr:hypothetical protein H2200_007185 [Cladophialophora chaetospira]
MKRVVMLKLAVALFLSVATSSIEKVGRGAGLEAHQNTDEELIISDSNHWDTTSLGGSILNQEQSPFLQPPDSSPNASPGSNGPWTHDPICTEYRPALNSTLCVYTDTTFNNGRGISIFTTPEIASQIADTISSLKAAEPLSIQAKTHPWTTIPVPNKGIGVIATEPLSRGDLVSSFHPYLVLHTENILSTTDEREKFLRLAISQLPKSSQEQFYDLAKMFDDERLVAQDVVKSNGFNLDVGGVVHVAVFPEASRFNHACDPNAQYYLTPDTLSHTIHATRPIQPNEEITISYTTPFRSYAQRQEYLKTAYDFTCSCSRCQKGEEADEPLHEINRIQSILGDWIPRDPSTSTESSAPSVRLAEQLIRLYQSLGLEGWLDYAYGNAALMYNSIGSIRGAKKYAHLAAESAKLRYGPESGDVAAWKTFEGDTQGHWSWMIRKSRPI